ncbi:hypothetical protein TNCT_151121, partial [Trichonephila clavata]
YKFLLSWSGHCRYRPSATPEFTNDADIAKSHEARRNDEHGHQLVDSYDKSYVVIGIPAVVSRNTR